LIGSPARADDSPREIARAVRVEVESIRDEVKRTEPYPGSQRWLGRLRDLGVRLAKAGDGQRFRWYDQALTDFGERNRDDALIVLDDLHRRVSLLEDTLAEPRRDAASGDAGQQPRRSADEVKSLLRGSPGRKRDSTRPREKVKEEREEPQRDEIRRDQQGEDGRRVRGSGGGPRIGASGGGGGFSILGWVLLAGLALAILAVAGYLFITRRREARAPKTQTATGREPAPDGEIRQVLEESPAALWRQAERCAGEGRFRDAVRVLYLAVLSLLHRQRLIRFEPTRTNGEYVRQVQIAEQAPRALHDPFERLTNLFESRWDGERPCESADYRATHTLAEEILQFRLLRCAACAARAKNALRPMDHEAFHLLVSGCVVARRLRRRGVVLAARAQPGGTRHAGILGVFGSERWTGRGGARAASSGLGAGGADAARAAGATARIAHSH
jgi:hypothetical protein